MRIYFLILVSIVCLNVLFAQESNPLFRIIEGGKFGFINKQGKVVIQPRFRYLGDFYEGLAVARLDSGYGFINQNGQFVIQPVYDYTKDFYDSLAIVISSSETFFINKSGEIRPYSYDEDMANKKRCFESDALLHSNKQVDSELLMCFDGERIQYKTQNGKVVWKQNSMHERTLHKLNIDHRTQQDVNCTEFPSAINNFKENNFKLYSQGIVLEVFPDENVMFSDSLIGIKIRLFNNYPYPDDTIFFRHPNVVIYLQVKQSNNTWRNLESICYMRCTSIINTERHKDTLIKFAPKSYYTFIAPTYEGIKKATFRYCMMTSIGAIQSSEFVGTYNPSQIESLDPFVPVTPLDSYFGKIRAANYKGRFYIEETMFPHCGNNKSCDE